MKVKTKDLLPAITNAARIAGKRMTVPVLNTLRLESANGQLSIRASDLDQEIEFHVEATEDMPAVCLSANHLQRLAMAAGQFVSFAPNGSSVHVESNYSAKLSKTNAEEFPKSMFKEGKAQGLVASDLADAIESVSWVCCDPKENRFALEHVHVVVSAKSVTAEASNGKSLARFEKAAIGAECEFLIHSNFVAQAATALRMPGATLSIADNCIRIQHDSGSYAFKLPNANYVSTKAILDTKKQRLGEWSIAEVSRIAETILALCADNIQSQVKLEFSAKGCLMSGLKTGGTDAFSETVAGKFKEKKIVVCANRLLAMVKSVRGETAIVSTNDIGRLCLEDGDYFAILQPLVQN